MTCDMFRCTAIDEPQVRSSPFSLKLGLSLFVSFERINHSLSYGSMHWNRYTVRRALRQRWLTLIFRCDLSWTLVHCLDDSRRCKIVGCCWPHSFSRHLLPWGGHACHEFNVLELISLAFYSKFPLSHRGWESIFCAWRNIINVQDQWISALWGQIEFF